MKCDLEARRAYPAERPFNSEKISDYIELCMRLAGYEFTRYGTSCEGPIGIRNEYCYKSTKGLSGFSIALKKFYAN